MKKPAQVILACCLVTPLILSSIGCGTNGDTESVQGTYSVTHQSGSDESGRPACLSGSKTIQDVLSVTPGLRYFRLEPVDESGEPAPIDSAVYYGFSECSSEKNCSEYYLLGSPTISDFTGSAEISGFGFVQGESVGECSRIRLSTSLEADTHEGLVHLEFVNDIVFVLGDPAKSLEEQEEECSNMPPEIPSDPCRRVEIVEGQRV